MDEEYGKFPSDWERMPGETIDEINTEELKKSVNKTTDGSINILKAFLENSVPNYDKSIIANLRNIVTLRSKKFPIHRDDPKFVEALRYFGFNFPSDWGELWEIALKKYLDSLEKLFNHVGERK